MDKVMSIAPRSEMVDAVSAAARTCTPCMRFVKTMSWTHGVWPAIVSVRAIDGVRSTADAA
jgi:hypothetical protein